MQKPPMKLGEYLVSKNILTEQEVQQVLTKQKELKSNRNSYTELGNVLITFNYISEDKLCNVIKEYIREYGRNSNFDPDLMYIATNTLNLTKEILTIIEKNFDQIKEYKTLPYRIDRDASGKIVNISYITMDKSVQYEEFITRFVSRNHYETSGRTIHRVFEYSFAMLIKNLAKKFGKSVEGSQYSTIYEMSLNDKIQNMFRDAVRIKASDIFITPFKDRVRVKFKADTVGKIYDDKFALPKDALSIANIILHLCNIPSTELNNGTVDGSIESLFGELDRSWSARVNIMNTVYGPKLVFRLIPNEQEILTLKQLGMPRNVESYVKENADKEAGLVLITGHMGSGKNTTIYASLLEMDTVVREVATVEDPVERRLDKYGISQTDVSGALDFMKVAGAMVRQALDVLFIGEIRDKDTIRLAVNAAGAGMLLFSTLHIDRVAQVWQRAYALDSEILPRFITALEGIMTQKLVRKICPKCKEEITYDDLTKEEKLYLQKCNFKIFKDGKPTLRKYSGKYFRGKGCPHCNGTGYKGVTVCTEILPLNYDIKLKLSALHNFIELEHYTDVYMEEHKLSFKYEGARLCNQGITTISEMMRKNVFDFEIDTKKE